MYINFPTFSRLYDEALEFEDLDYYIAVRGWQDWMVSEKNTDKVVTLLTTIHEIARGDMSLLRQKLGITQVQMCVEYNIPPKTLQNWENEDREPTPLVRQLLSYAVIMTLLNQK